MNITNASVPYFDGNESWQEAVSKAAELVVPAFAGSTFVCDVCGKIVFPKLTTDEHGIFIESNRTEIRGGKGNRCIKRDVCENCARKMKMKGRFDMNTMLFPEDVANVVQSFLMCNKGDEATEDLILSIGAELLDISQDEMLEMVR